VKRWPLVLLPLLSAGCVDRFISVRSDPPGASVLLDGEPAGRTPVEIPYTWYGTREVTLELRGYRSVTRMVPLPAPWWQYLPFDFITDVLLPFRIHDRTELLFLMEAEPQGPAELEGLKARADELRQKTRK
jgi:hypothetical protein